MTVIIGRSGWGALPPNRVIPQIDTIDSFVIHHSVTAQPGSFDESVEQVQRIQRQHLGATNPDGSATYSDIAYNVVAGWNCALVGRGVVVSDGATDNDPSTRTWSLCVLGDYRNDLVTPECRAGIVAGLQLGFDLYQPHPIRPHRDFYATACPGQNLIDQIPSLQAELGDDDNMTPADMDYLAKAIVREWFAHPMTLQDGQPPHDYPTTAEGTLAFIHRELQLIRTKP